MLIAITGKAGAGKDTIGDYLVRKYGVKKIALADPIKRLVKDVFVLDDHTVYDREEREKPLVQWNGWSVRKLLQFIGTELFRQQIDDQIWVKSLWLRISGDKQNNYCVTDLRFPNELSFFRENAKDDFVCIKVVRPGCDGNVGLSGHASESYDLKGDYEIINDGSIENLTEKIEAVLRKINL
jgi:hypothetical protein